MRIDSVHIDVLLLGVNAKDEIIRENRIALLQFIDLFIQFDVLIQIGKDFNCLFLLIAKIVVRRHQDNHVNSKDFHRELRLLFILEHIAYHITEAMRKRQNVNAGNLQIQKIIAFLDPLNIELLEIILADVEKIIRFTFVEKIANLFF